MKILHISDTHSYHKLLTIPKDIDIIIFSGDESNYYDPYLNEPETRDFLNWYAALDIPNKIFIAGNHSAAIAKGLVTRRDFQDRNITFLENESAWVDGIHIWGSPYSPSFGNWYFMKPRNTINRLWDGIPEDVDILVTHSPAKGKLDLTYHGMDLVQVGDSALGKRIRKIKPKMHLFGHIHDNEGLTNAGILQQDGIIYSNGSVVTDGAFGRLSSQGNILEYENF